MHNFICMIYIKLIMAPPPHYLILGPPPCLLHLEHWGKIGQTVEYLAISQMDDREFWRGQQQLWKASPKLS
jgi:hypothetical protein